MSEYYRIILLGETNKFSNDLESILSNLFNEFKLVLHKDIRVIRKDDQYDRSLVVSTVGLYFGATPYPNNYKHNALHKHHPLLPIVSDINKCEDEIHPLLLSYNAIAISDEVDLIKLASAILESLGLTSSKRRVFLSYRRSETKQIALQLHDKLSEYQFDVFLDTHDIRPGLNFQNNLLHHLSDADVMLMLDSKTYFESKWTHLEFTRANIKKSAILRVGWPGIKPNPDLSVTTSINLQKNCFDKNQLLESSVVENIIAKIESMRSKSVSVREANLIGTFKTAVNSFHGFFGKPGIFRRLDIEFRSGKKLLVYPVVGIPDSTLVHAISNDAKENDFALLYDHIGVLEAWIEHMEWLGLKIPNFRWIQVYSSGEAIKKYIGEP